MPETISLRAYLAGLEEQLRTHATDEVVHHCRHILQYFPKHVDTYRLLGRALLYNARWDEATAVLRRVLAVYPDGRVAHLGLAEIYDERNQGNQALWHMERAFEHDPNNEEIIASLRDLLKRVKGADYAKIQLTAGAVARQYGRNGLYEQAVDTLRPVLESHEDRVDLRLLLAQMLWGAEQPVEAAEVALDVLALLPDCLEANRILTRLWLLEDRPSDAQRYINSIEAVDPYAALELATGTQAPDNAFTLPELDYRRYAESVLTANQPDWLQDIDEESLASVFSEPALVPRAPAPPAEPAAGEDLPDEQTITAVPSDWLTDTDKQRLSSTSSLPRLQEEKPDVDLRFDDTLDDVEPPEPTTGIAARDLRRETSSLASIYTPRDGDDEVPDWLADADDEPAELPEQIQNSADPLAWLRDAGIELDESEPEPVEVPDFEPLEPAEEDPLAWMRDSGIEIDEEDLAALTHEHPVVNTSDDEDAEDPLAWLRDSNIEIDESAPAPQLFDPYETENDTPISDPDADPLGWMSAYSEEIVWGDETGTPQPEAPASEASPAAPAPEPDDGDDANPYAWLYESGVEFEPNEPPPATPPPAPASGGDDAEDNFDWLQDDTLLEDRPTVTQLFDDDPPASVDEDKITTGLLRRLDAAAQIEETTILDNDAAAEAPADEFNWFTDAGGSAQAPAPQDAEMADWREAMSDKDNNLNPDWNGEDENAAGADSTPDWLQDFAVDEDAPAQPAEDVPEWLAALGPNYVQPESADAEQHHTPDDAGESDVADVADESAAFAWSAQVEDDDAGEPAAVPNQPDDFPAWLQSETTGDSGSAAQDLNPDWLSDFQSEADLQPEAESGELAQSEDIPDWLSELQPPEASSAPAIAALDDEDEQDESFGWIDQMIEQAESGGEAVQQPAASADSEIEPAEPPAWLPDFASDEEPAEDEPAPVELEMPDWLNDLAEAEPAGEPLSESADEVLEVETFEWASEAEPAEEQDVVAPAASLETEAADEEPEPEPAAQSDTFSWSNTFDTTAPMAPVDVEDDTPDWLKDFQTEDEVVDTTADESTVVTVQPGEQPEWLSEALASTDEEAAEPEAVGSAFDEFDFEMAEAADEPPVAETEAAGAGNAPDWLNAMVPGVDLDYTPESDEVAEPEPVAPVSERRPERDFEWLVDIVEEETQPSPGPAVAAEPEAPRFSFSKLPAWLRGKQASAGDSSD